MDGANILFDPAACAFGVENGSSRFLRNVVIAYQTTRLHIPEVRNLNIHRLEGLKPQID
jgi:hypothetical protein